MRFIKTSFISYLNCVFSQIIVVRFRFGKTKYTQHVNSFGHFVKIWADEVLKLLHEVVMVSVVIHTLFQIDYKPVVLVLELRIFKHIFRRRFQTRKVIIIRTDIFYQRTVVRLVNSEVYHCICELR